MDDLFANRYVSGCLLGSAVGYLSGYFLAVDRTTLTTAGSVGGILYAWYSSTFTARNSDSFENINGSPARLHLGLLS